ncbi:hypothetical protein [Actinoplanes sp. NPDC051494]|uniref:hypothetical protein n=1 Tax=Actinoplanes sp. NPDC051494 TaxID=3363907 RepID=UPI0037962B75
MSALLPHVHGVLADLVRDVPGNPDPSPPPGVSGPVETLMSYVKWGVLVVIITAGFVGAGAVAGGRLFANHGASRTGLAILLSALAGAVLYAGVYALITAVAG